LVLKRDFFTADSANGAINAKLQSQNEESNYLASTIKDLYNASS
jgi:hypothetical protein